MTALHVYTASAQPATAWVDRCGDVEIRGGWEPSEMLRCQCCRAKRRADRCVVQCYYDGLYVWCAEGHGCKHPQSIASKRRRAHMNRSRAQQARRARERALKRDIEFAIVQNQGSSAGSTSVARSSAGLESMIAGNRIFPATTNSVGTTAGYSSGAWAAPVDGTTAALAETAFVEALQAAWTDGGDPSVIMMGATLKRRVATFGGATKFLSDIIRMLGNSVASAVLSLPPSVMWALVAVAVLAAWLFGG